MELITLYAFRERKSSYNMTTTLKDSNGKVTAIFSSMLRQPRYGQKTIVINCWKFALDWSNVPNPRKSAERKNKKQ